MKKMKLHISYADWLNENEISLQKRNCRNRYYRNYKRKCSGKQVIAVRAEMDALPVTERNKTDYSSLNTVRCMHVAMMLIWQCYWEQPNC